MCEGIPDALTAAQAGFVSVGVLGSQAPDHSVASRIATRAEKLGLTPVAVIDNDAAGRAWGERLSCLLAEHGVDLHVVEPPEDGMDLNAWALRDASWQHSVDQVEAPTAEGARSSPDCDVSNVAP